MIGHIRIVKNSKVIVESVRLIKCDRCSRTFEVVLGDRCPHCWSHRRIETPLTFHVYTPREFVVMPSAEDPIDLGDRLPREGD